MSTQIITLDRERKLVYDWDALLLLEKMLGVVGPGEIIKASTKLGYADLFRFLRAGMLHDDKTVTEEKVKQLVAKHCQLSTAHSVLWPIVIQAMVEDLGLTKAVEGEDEKNAASPDQIKN
jgi:hypothetical protein